MDCPEDTSEVASTLGTVMTDNSNVTTRTEKSAKMRRGFSFIIQMKGIRNAKAALALMTAKKWDKAEENRLCLRSSSHGTSVSGASSSQAPPAEMPTQSFQSAELTEELSGVRAAGLVHHHVNRTSDGI